MKNFRSSIHHACNADARPTIGRSTRVIATVLAMVAAVPALSADVKLDDVTASMVAVNRAAADSQRRIDDLSDRTQDAASRYAEAVSEAESYEQYNAYLSNLLKSQEEQIASIGRQLQQIEVTRRGVSPLMNEMVQALARFVALDVPFLPEERAARVRELEEMIPRADVSIAEKYRIILQAYMIELDYGRTLGAYEGILGESENGRAVRFVRVGRVALMYQTLDGSETGYWDINQKKWVVDNDYAESFEQALQMANQRGTPQLLTVPVPVPRQEGKA